MNGREGVAVAAGLAAVVGAFVAVLTYVAPHGSAASSTPAGQASSTTVSGQPQTLTASPSGQSVSSDSAIPSATIVVATSAAAGPLYLADQPPNYDESGGYSGGNNQVTLVKTLYARSPYIACISFGYNTSWAVPANYTTFTAAVGIDDNSNAVHETAHLTFSDQNGASLAREIDVSIGHPQTVTFQVTTVSQLRIHCFTTGDSVDPHPAFSADLGDARFTN